MFVAAIGLAPAQSASAAQTVAWAPAASAAIHPGIQTYDTHGAQCTANFVYTDRSGAVYIGQASHCTSESGELSGSGCETASSPLGSEVDLGNNVKGTLAYSSWMAMQKAGDTNEDECLNNDFALVKIPASAVSTVNPSVPVFGGPTGVSTDPLQFGDPVMGIGNSTLRGGTEAPLQGASLSEGNNGWYPPRVPVAAGRAG